MYSRPLLGVLYPLLEQSGYVTVRQAIDGPLAVTTKCHEVAVAQQPQLVAYRRGADIRDRGEIAHTEFAGGQRKEYPQACRIGERREDVSRGTHTALVGQCGTGMSDGCLVDHCDGAGFLGTRILM
jgi:hypothetical protein